MKLLATTVLTVGLLSGVSFWLLGAPPPPAEKPRGEKPQAVQPRDAKKPAEPIKEEHGAVEITGSVLGPDGKPRDTIGSGRYLDKLERRGDEWRITRRIVITDWFRDYPDSGDWEVGPLGMKVPPGGRHPDDLSYSFLTLR